MTLIIDDPEVEKLVSELVAITGESPTDVVRKALLERKGRLLESRRKKEESITFLEEEVWPNLPEGERGRMPTQEEQDEILGYGPHGV